MRTLRITIFMLALLGLLTACAEYGGPLNIIHGSGNVVTEVRDLSDFTAVSLQGVGRLIIDQTGSESVKITADDNLMPFIETRVQGGKLIISLQEDTTFNDITELVYHVTVKSINSLELDGAGEIEVAHLDGEAWQTQLDGGGSVTVSGKVAHQDVEINGIGVYNAEALSCQHATVEQNGAGVAVVQVSDQLDVTIEGVGSVEYIGNPTVKQTLNGLGTVKQR